MKTIPAAEFKAKCLAILDEVAATGEIVEVTKRGTPVARLIPTSSATTRFPQDSLRGTARTIGDIMGPVGPAEDWGALRE